MDSGGWLVRPRGRPACASRNKRGCDPLPTLQRRDRCLLSQAQGAALRRLPHRDHERMLDADRGQQPALLDCGKFAVALFPGADNPKTLRICSSFSEALTLTPRPRANRSGDRPDANAPPGNRETRPGAIMRLFPRLPGVSWTREKTCPRLLPVEIGWTGWRWTQAGANRSRPLDAAIAPRRPC